MISDDALVGRMGHLLEFFEYYWADVAWDLKRARTLPSVRQALRRGQSPPRYVLEPFTYEPTRRANFDELRATQKDISRIESFLRSALQDESEAKRRLQTAVNAVNNDSNDERLQRLRTRKEQEHSSLTRQIAGFYEQLPKLRLKLREEEAHVAQSELLDFIGSARYTLSPVSYAKAMAGVPMITWRQSALRSAKLPILHPYPAEHQKFRLFLKAFGRPASLADAIGRVKSALRSSRRGDYATETLKREWYYLRSAIETAYQNSPARQAIPYRAFAEYRRRTSSQSPSDQVLADDEAL